MKTGSISDDLVGLNPNSSQQIKVFSERPRPTQLAMNCISDGVKGKECVSFLIQTSSEQESKSLGFVVCLCNQRLPQASQNF